jgi:hypothetical protein
MQKISFRLHTWSNMSSVRKKVTNGISLLISNEGKKRFPSYKFCLKKRLDESAQFKIMLQIVIAHQPVRTNPLLSFTHKEFRS